VTVLERFMAKVVWNGGEDECWIWEGSVSPNGYGEFWLDGVKQFAHRVAYKLFVGPIPEGLQVDHVRERGCVNRNCVNPAHLEPVAQRENLLRGDTISAKASAATHCPQGHPYDAENTHVRANGHRQCRACQRIRQRAYKSRLAVTA
jgi:hypothetical protein